MSHGVPASAVIVGRHRTLGSDGRTVECGEIRMWPAEWDERVSMLRCERCGTTFSGTFTGAVSRWRTDAGHVDFSGAEPRICFRMDAEHAATIRRLLGKE